MISLKWLVEYVKDLTREPKADRVLRTCPECFRGFWGEDGPLPILCEECKRWRDKIDKENENNEF